MSDVTQPQAFSRMDQSFLGAWWWTVDRTLLACVLSLMLFGVALVASASPAVAEKIGVGDYHFLKKHIIFLIPSILILIGVSMVTPRQVWRMASLILIGAVTLMFLVLFFGDEVKGARRWILLFGFSVQPSEFIKPAFAVVAAWLIALHKDSIHHADTMHVTPVKNVRLPVFYGYHIAVALYVFLITLLLMQPDLGMTVVLTTVFAVQVFLAGLRFRYLAILLGAGAGGLTAAYFAFSHVRSRVDRYFNPESGDNYQVEQSLDAIRHGGFAGVGPGQGVEKLSLPDAHADFIFSVLVEEMGLLFALIMMGIFLYIMLRGFRRLQDTQDVFSVLAAGGLLAMFGFQSLIHIGSAVNLLPAKGMTLPFVSYGGSSMLSMSLSMGFVLALTRQKKRKSIARSSLSMRRANPSREGGQDDE
tara:strand:- start:3022 stop:4272 length:1251 start_codon:yes stop_codon:yes gene_type:complete